MDYITSKECAEILGISLNAVRVLVKDGKLTNHKMSFAKSMLFDKQEVLALKFNDKKDYYTRKQAGKLLGISQAMLSYYAKTYGIKPVKLQYGLERVLFKKSDIARLKKYLV